MGIEVAIIVLIVGIFALFILSSNDDDSGAI